LIDHAPKVVQLPTDTDEDLAEVPLVARPRSLPLQRVGEHPPETQPLFSYAFAVDHHTASGQDQFNLAKPRTEAVIQPHSMLDHFNRKAKAAIGIRCRHAMDADTAASGLPT
jgi:hypothetical protein